MIQELLGGGALLEEKKIPLPTNPIHSPLNNILDGNINSNPTSMSSTTTSSSSVGVENQNLKCPRCDSSNTKFCYYNNYNLTQPRHFCKTCRRYWTKGGALRNVPIGGGCRKSKSIGSSLGAVCKPVANKLARSGPLERPNQLLGNALDNFSLHHHHRHDQSANPIMWASAHNSNLFSLLNPNPNPNPNLVRVKEDYSSLVPDATLVANALQARPTHGFEHVGHVPLMWKNTNHYQIPQQNINNNNNNNNMLFGGGDYLQAGTSGLHELYQRLKSTSQFGEHPNVGQPNMGSSAADSVVASNSSVAAMSGSIMEATPLGVGGEFGVWNMPISWSDMSAANGAFP